LRALSERARTGVSWAMRVPTRAARTNRPESPKGFSTLGLTQRPVGIAQRVRSCWGGEEQAYSLQVGEAPVADLNAGAFEEAEGVRADVRPTGPCADHVRTMAMHGQS